MPRKRMAGVSEAGTDCGRGICKIPVRVSYAKKVPAIGVTRLLEQMLGLLDRLVDSGKAVIVFKGTPAELVKTRSTLTGEHLAAYVG